MQDCCWNTVTIYLFPSAGIAFHLTLRSLSLFLPRNSAPGSAPVSYHVAKKLVFKKVRKALGLDRCTKCYTGAAPITKDTLEFFLSLNIPLCELYGMSESSGPHTISRHDAFKLTRYIFLFALVWRLQGTTDTRWWVTRLLSCSCGIELPGCKTKLHNKDEEGNGEICFWGRHVFMGYLNMPDKTEEALDAEGWLHSGDLGKQDENGFLFITGRIKGTKIALCWNCTRFLFIYLNEEHQFCFQSYILLQADCFRFVLLFVHRADHHSRRREHPSRPHRGCGEGGRAAD